MWKDLRLIRAARWWAASAMFVIATLASIAGAGAADRTNVPLKNWGGFAEYRDSVYDDLERLVTAGLADRVLLNTKPLSRVEVARMIARAIEKIRGDEAGAYNERRDLEPVLDRLMEEFKVELAGLGVRTAEGVTPPGFVSFTPVDRAQVFAGFATDSFSLVNAQGHSVKRGANGGFTFESRMQIGDFLSFYLQPETILNEDYSALRLNTGYVKLTLFNFELMYGRDSLAWGPGYHNSLILGNNAAPLEQVRLGSAEPFLLPWIGQWVGPMKAMIFLAQLEERRDHPFTKLAGMRITNSPASFLELGLSRTVMFDGCCPYLPLSKYPAAIFNPAFGDDVSSHPENRTNNLTSTDFEFRFRNVDRYLPISRDLRLYGEFYWDDTCGECIQSGFGRFFAANFLPLGSTVGGVGGVHFLGLFGQDWLDARFEYARSSVLSFNHTEFQSGYWTRGHVISDFIGTDGQDVFARFSARLMPNLMLGVDIDRATIGSTTPVPQGPQEKRFGGGIDLSYRFWDHYSLFVQYLISDVKNRHFVPGDDRLEHVVRLELTRSFR